MAMAVGQALSFRSFAVALRSYGVTTAATLRPTAIGIVAAEAVAAGALLLGVDGVRCPGAILALGIAVAWTALAAVALYRRREVENCGCFGKYVSQPLRPSVLVQDALFVGLAIWVVIACLS